MRTYIKAYMSLNFGQILPVTTELAALERLKNRCHHVISVDIDPIFFKLAGNKDMHNIMNEFEFRPDRTTDYGVSCPWASKRNTPIDLIMWKMVFPLFLCCFWLDPFDTFMQQEQALKLGWVWIFWNEIWPWHIGLRWAIVALWATCLQIFGKKWELIFHEYAYFRKLFQFSSIFLLIFYILPKENLFPPGIFLRTFF